MQVGKQPRGYRNRRTAFAAFHGASRPPVDHARVKVEQPPSTLRIHREAQEGAVPLTRIEADQDEPGEVAVDLGLVADASAIPTEGACQESRRLISGQVAFPRFGLGGKGYRDGSVKLPLLPTPT